MLAASGGDLGELTRDKPKCMVDMRGQSLLQRLVSTLTEAGVRETTVVRGYRKEAVAVPGIKIVDNDRYAETGEVDTPGRRPRRRSRARRWSSTATCCSAATSWTA